MFCGYFRRVEESCRQSEASGSEQKLWGGRTAAGTPCAIPWMLMLLHRLRNEPTVKAKESEFPLVLPNELFKRSTGNASDRCYISLVSKKAAPTC